MLQNFTHSHASFTSYRVRKEVLMKNSKMYMLKRGAGVLALAFTLSVSILGSHSALAATASPSCSSNHTIQIAHTTSNCGSHTSSGAQSTYYPNPNLWPSNW